MKNKNVGFAKVLRKRSTDAENCLWKHLRGKQLEGLKFRRQQPLDDYIADFVCFEKRIVIEVDGGDHALQRKKDEKRDKYLMENNFKILRFWNNEILQNIEGVIEVIQKECFSHPPLDPLPSREGEENK